MKQIIILGAGYAGMMAALRLSHSTKNRKDVQITLVNAASHFVERIRLHEVAAGHPQKTDAIQDLLKGTNVNFLEAWVTEIQPDKHSVIAQANGEKLVLHYDKLVYALGSRVNQDAVVGIREHAYTLDADSAPKMQIRLKELAKTGGRVMVIGGGLTGIEAATEIAETYPKLRVSLLTNGKLGENLSSLGQNYLYQVFSELGIEVLENHHVKELKANEIILTNGEKIATDLILWAAGFTVPSLAKEAGLAVNKYGRILVDAYLRSQSHSDIYAAGDGMDFDEHSPLTVRMSCQAAMPLGAHVGDNLANWLKGKEEKPFEFGYSAQCIGLGQKRGLLQFIKPDDSVVERILTGWQGALVKKVILNYTLGMIKLERIVPFVFQWPHTHKIEQAVKAQELILESR